MKTIFYIDDDVEDIGFFEEVVAQMDSTHVVKSFSDTPSAMDYLEDATEKPDIIFLDVNMPKLSGKETLLLIRRKSHFKDVPVIMFSTTIRESEKQSFMECGATDFLKKGFSAEVLRKSIGQLLNTANTNEEK